MAKTFLPSIGKQGLRKLSHLLKALCWTEGLLGAALAVLAARPLTTLSTYLPGISLLYPGMLKNQLLIGVFVCLLSIIGILVSNSSVEQTFQPATGRLQVIWTTISLLLIVFIIIVTILLSEASGKATLQVVDTLGRGLGQYLMDKDWRHRMDKLQVEMKCCGVSDHEDWFKARWLPMYFFKESMLVSQRLSPDGRLEAPVLPFSCCSLTAKAPCLHDSLQQNFSGHQTAYLETVYMNGCAGAILDPIVQGLSYFRIICVLVSIFQAGQVIIARILYISSRKSSE